MEGKNASESLPYWDITSITTQLAKENIAFVNLKTCFGETTNFCQGLIKTLNQIKIGFSSENPLMADRNKEIIKELTLITDKVQTLVKYLSEELVKSLDDFSEYYSKNYNDLIEKSHMILEKTKEDKITTENIKEEYFAQAEAFNKLQENLIKEEPSNELIVKSRQNRKETYDAYHKYCKSIKDSNLMINNNFLKYTYRELQINSKRTRNKLKVSLKCLIQHINKKR